MENPVDQVKVVKKLIENEALLLSIGDVANAINVSTRQLRYWEKKGYIESKASKSGQRKYTYFTMLQAGNIANFINQGFTLTKAVEKANYHAKLMKSLRRFLKDRFNEGNAIENGYEIDLGIVKDFPEDQHLFISVLDNGERSFQIKSVKD